MHTRLKHVRLCVAFSTLMLHFLRHSVRLKVVAHSVLQKKMVDIKFTAVSEAKRNIKAVEISLLAALHKSYIPN